MPSGEPLWFQTENGHKFREAKSILYSRSIQIRQLKQPKTEIQRDRLQDIARYALETALHQYKRRILIEDSGLFVDVLNGFPGPYSSYVHATIGLNGLLNLMKDRSNRRAYFHSSVAFGSPDLSPRVFTGTVDGRVSKKALGNSGFGYDPIFIPNGSNKTFGQASAAFKNMKSHRTKAFLKFANWYKRTILVPKRSQADKRALK